MSTGATERTMWLFEQFCGKSLKQPVSARYEGLSQINANGLPFQWLSRIGDERFPVAFVCESGEPGSSCWDRYQHSWQVLDHIFGDDKGAALPIIRRLVETYILPEADNWPSHWRSAIWFGVVAGDHGFATKVYFNLNEGAATDRWRRIGNVLLHLGRKNGLQQLCDLSSSVSPHSWPVGMAFDLIPGKPVGRVKVYFRSGRVTRSWLARWYQTVDASQNAFAISSLLDTFPLLDHSYYPEQSIHVSLEFPANDTNVTLKSDLNFTRFLSLDETAAQACVGQLADRIGLDASGYRRDVKVLISKTALRQPDCLHRFVGVGLEADGSCHMNIYVEPDLAMQDAGAPSIRKPKKAEAIRRAMDFLSTRLKDDHWVDFNLPVGVSDEWVTAYTLMVAGRFPSHSCKLQTSWMPAVAQWLRERQHAGGGWGYHGATPSDADSTTLALHALTRWGIHMPDAQWLPLLARFQNKEGGFSTYLSNPGGEDAWNGASPDVTGLAGALVRRVSASSWEKSVKYLRRIQNENGMWDSYWWLTPLYATWVVLECLDPLQEVPRRRELEKSLVSYSPTTDFEIALLVQCWMSLGRTSPCKDWIHELLRSQLANGAWESGAFLRLTHPHVASPHTSIDSGTVYSDCQKVFTTATVLGALSRYQDSF
jgi:hypothetical protein